MKLTILALTLFAVVGMGIADSATDSDTAANVINSSRTISFGQENLFAILEMSGGFNGTIYLDDTFGSRHEECMFLALTRLTPSQHVVRDKDGAFGVYSAADWEGWGKELKKRSVRVIHSPNTFHIFGDTKEARTILKNNDILNVYGSGNVYTAPHIDIFHPDDPYWGPGTAEQIINDVRAGREYQETEAYFQTGHVIMSGYAVKKPATFEEYLGLVIKENIAKLGGIEGLREAYRRAGEYVRHPNLIRFGSLKEYGFSVLLTDSHIPCGVISQAPSASSASAHLAAFAFYLFQLWDTTAEVVEVMQKTAIDIGAPGPDEEFGWGLINADHPIIWNRAIERLQQSLSFCLLEDVAFEEAVASARGEGFDLFYDGAAGKKEIGLSYNRDRATLALTTGSGSRLFGLNSGFLRQQNTFVQCGLRYDLTDNTSLVGVFGHSEQEDVRINKGSFGVSYRNNFSGRGDVSLYTGYRTIRGTLGLPGYETAGAKKVPFALHMPEVRASFGWSF